MDKGILTEYENAKKKVADIRKRIEKLEDDILQLEAGGTVADTVSLGKKGKRTIGIVKVSGVAVVAISRKRAALAAKRELLEKKEVELIEAGTKAETYISGIESSELRLMFRYHFLDGLTYAKIAHEMNHAFFKQNRGYTADSVRQKINRYLKNEDNAAGGEV